MLTDAAIGGKEDYLQGLKENVIMGRIIRPARVSKPTGMWTSGLDRKESRTNKKLDNSFQSV